MLADSTAVELLLDALADADAAVRADAVAALAACKDERVLDALRDADAAVRLAELAAVLKQNDPAAVPSLMSVLLRGSPDEKRRPARAVCCWSSRPGGQWSANWRAWTRWAPRSTR